MADPTILPSISTRSSTRLGLDVRRTRRPPPLRISSDLEAVHSPQHGGEDPTPSVKARPRRRSNVPLTNSPRIPSGGQRRTSHASVSVETLESEFSHWQHQSPCERRTADMPTPPHTPMGRQTPYNTEPPGFGADDVVPTILAYDFSKLDYELARATLLGEGLWSRVHLADAIVTQSKSPRSARLTPPISPPDRHHAIAPRLFAVKTALGRDAQAVFRQEATILTHLMRVRYAASFIVPFYGIDERHSTLLFEAVLGGSLTGLNGRLEQMTEIARHRELVSLFPILANDLVNGLDFLHAAGVVHADIKPGNIMLDMDESLDAHRPVIRARYIDFSASFRPQTNSDSTEFAGGTWEYLAPEQMRAQPEWSTPTYASDVWSLGITLLSLIVGNDPYAAACNSRFMLREAIKMADPIGFAKYDSRVAKRLAACQEFVDCCRLAFQKDRDRRPTASMWKLWISNNETFDL